MPAQVAAMAVSIIVYPWAIHNCSDNWQDAAMAARVLFRDVSDRICLANET